MDKAAKSTSEAVSELVVSSFLVEEAVLDLTGIAALSFDNIMLILLEL